jgi:hypothetical protein
VLLPCWSGRSPRGHVRGMSVASRRRSPAGSQPACEQHRPRWSNRAFEQLLGLLDAPLPRRSADERSLHRAATSVETPQAHRLRQGDIGLAIARRR